VKPTSIPAEASVIFEMRDPTTAFDRLVMLQRFAQHSMNFVVGKAFANGQKGRSPDHSVNGGNFGPATF
jgi:hypothetical protein